MCSSQSDASDWSCLLGHSQTTLTRFWFSLTTYPFRWHVLLKYERWQKVSCKRSLWMTLSGEITSDTWRWWDWNQAIFLTLSYFILTLSLKFHFTMFWNIYSWIIKLVKIIMFKFLYDLLPPPNLGTCANVYIFSEEFDIITMPLISMQLTRRAPNHCDGA